ncbi:MAG: basic amino acid ABC transporter substrate-binding protein [Clostridia bacterium]|nr:basic amino acid ABC transporter substrate-binding protein [Clostridia bacterium]
MKKILALALCALMVAVCFVGCGTTPAQTDAAPTTTAAADAAAETEAAPAKQETLVMGTNATFPPYEFVDDNGKIVGIDAEIAAAIADKLGATLEIKDMEFDSLIPAVQNGAIDFAMAGMTVTEERKLSVDFSDTYAQGVQVVIVPENSTIASIDDLDGKMIGVQSGTTGDIYCTGDYGEDHVKQFTNGALAVAALQNGQVDCVVIDNEPAKNFVAANAGLKILDTAYAEEDYAIAIAKTSSELLKNVNDALAALKADGTVAKIIEKYIPAN